MITSVVGVDEPARSSSPPIARPTPRPRRRKGFRNAPPQSDYWAQLLSPYAFPAGFPRSPPPPTSVPWTVKGYTPAQIKGAYYLRRLRWRGTDGGDYRRLRLADDPAGVNQWSLNRGLPTMNTSQFAEVWRLGPRGARRIRAGSAGLVRRGDARRRGRAWHGTRREHRLRRRAEQLPGSRRGAQPLVDQHLAQIVTNSYGWTARLLPPGFIKPFNDTLIQAAAEASASTSPPAITATRPTSSASPPPTARLEPVGHRGRRHQPRRRARPTRACWRPAGAPATISATDHARPYRTAWLYGSGGGVSKVFAKPSYQSPEHPRPRRAGCRGAGRPADRPAGRPDPKLP